MHMAQRTHGYAKKGKVIQYQVPVQRSPNISILPAMTIDGYIACSIYHGAVNGDRFVSFLEHDLLP